jgi:YVTN family beta-propeller protein
MQHFVGLGLVFCALATSAQAARIYVSNEDGHSVSVLDAAHTEVIATIAVGKRPRGMKLNRDGSRLFVAVSGLQKCPPTTPDEECAKRERDLKADGIAVVDTRSHKVIRVLQAGSDPEQFDVSPDGKRLFVANEDVALLSVLDIEGGATVKRIPVGREPEGVGVTPDGRWVLVTNESDNSVSMVDTKTLEVVRSVRVGLRPRDLAFTPDSRAAYVSGELDASLYRIRVPQGEPVERVLQLRKEARPMAVVLDVGRNRLYMSTGRGGTVAVVDTASTKLLSEIPVGTRPWGIALSKDGRWLYTANGPSNDVSVVDTSALREVHRIPVGRSPWGVVVGPAPPAKKRNQSETSGAEASDDSVAKPAASKRAGFRVPIELGHFSSVVGVAEQPAPFAGQAGVFRKGGSFDEVVVAESVRDPVDDAGALMQVGELAAVCRDALLHKFDARMRRIVVAGRIGASRGARQVQTQEIPAQEIQNQGTQT